MNADLALLVCSKARLLQGSIERLRALFSKVESDADGETARSVDYLALRQAVYDCDHALFVASGNVIGLMEKAKGVSLAESRTLAQRDMEAFLTRAGGSASPSASDGLADPIRS